MSYSDLTVRIKVVEMDAGGTWVCSCMAHDGDAVSEPVTRKGD